VVFIWVLVVVEFKGGTGVGVGVGVEEVVVEAVSNPGIDRLVEFNNGNWDVEVGITLSTEGDRG
jgi:hypothetical protein